jgi:hypothetical protein
VSPPELARILAAALAADLRDYPEGSPETAGDRCERPVTGTLRGEALANATRGMESA